MYMEIVAQRILFVIGTLNYFLFSASLILFVVGIFCGIDDIEKDKTTTLTMNKPFRLSLWSLILGITIFVFVP